MLPRPGAKTTKRQPAARPQQRRRGAAAPYPWRSPPARTAATVTSALVIVESPAKAKTIGKYLGRGYRVKATVGHLRDLPEKRSASTSRRDSRPST